MSTGTDILQTDYSQYACTVEINGIPLSATYEIISVQIKSGYQFISSADILIKQDVGFGESLFPNPLEKLPLAGEQVTIKATLSGDVLALFEGVIVRHKYKNSSVGTRLQLTAKNNALNLAMTTQIETFAKQTDKDIIEGLVQKQGLTLETSHLSSELSGMHTQLIKPALSDWDFINCRAEANRCFVFTEKDKVRIDKPTSEADPTKIIQVTFGSNVYALELEQDDRKNNITHEIIQFDTAELQGIAITEENAPAPQPLLIKGLHSESDYGTFDEAGSNQRLSSLTDLKTLSAINGMAHIYPNLIAKPGDTMQLTGYNELADKQFIITSVLHDYSDGGFSTYLQFGLQHQSFASKYQLEMPSAKSPVMTSGVVVKLEKDPANLYRIQVQIPLWKHAQEPIWARLSTMYAGKDYGMVVLPEIGDEVIVAFMGHDNDTPVILGSVFSPKFPPHTEFEDNNFMKVFQTKKGMRWSWDDEKGIHEISTPAGNKFVISEDEKAIKITDQHNNKIEMTQDGISIEAQLDIVLKASKDIKMEAVNIELNASGINTIKGSIIKIN